MRRVTVAFFCCMLILLTGFSVMAAPVGVKMDTSMGTIILRLDRDKAPATVANFVKYVQAGFYDNTVFHRVIPGFMIQGGGFTADMTQKQTNDPVKNEAGNGLPNEKYSLAMARTSDPDSATAQFFINTADNVFLNYKAPTPQGWGYAVFGKVIRGQNVVDAIEKVPTTRKGMHEDVPRDVVLIKKVTIID